MVNGENDRPIGAGFLCPMVHLTVGILLRALCKAFLELEEGPGLLPEFPLFTP